MGCVGTLSLASTLGMARTPKKSSPAAKRGRITKKKTAAVVKRKATRSRKTAAAAPSPTARQKKAAKKAATPVAKKVGKRLSKAAKVTRQAAKKTASLPRKVAKKAAKMAKKGARRGLRAADDLAAMVENSVAPVIRRKPGRPRKVVAEPMTPTTLKASTPRRSSKKLSQETSELVVRRVGRPRKHPVADEVLAEPKLRPGQRPAGKLETRREKALRQIAAAKALLKKTTSSGARRQKKKSSEDSAPEASAAGTASLESVVASTLCGLAAVQDLAVGETAENAVPNGGPDGNAQDSLESHVEIDDDDERDDDDLPDNTPQACKAVIEDLSAGVAEAMDQLSVRVRESGQRQVIDEDVSDESAEELSQDMD